MLDLVDGTVADIQVVFLIFDHTRPVAGQRLLPGSANTTIIRQNSLKTIVVINIRLRPMQR